MKSIFRLFLRTKQLYIIYNLQNNELKSLNALCTQYSFSVIHIAQVLSQSISRLKSQQGQMVTTV